MVVLLQHIVDEAEIIFRARLTCPCRVIRIWKIRAACTLDFHGGATTAHCG